MVPVMKWKWMCGPRRTRRRSTAWDRDDAFDCHPLEPRVLLAGGSADVSAGAGATTFAVIGDFGTTEPPTAQVADLVKGWSPDFIITTGDNNYPFGAASTIDPNLGQYYHDYIYNYRGVYGAGSPTRRFFPSIGNHDWSHVEPPMGFQPYLDYFDLPGNERYYEFASGPVRLFSLNSDTHEPDGLSQESTQGRWLKERLAAAREPWKIVYFHHAPHAAGLTYTHYMRWPFKGWGASAVITGHLHRYERFTVDGLPYVTNGIGGAFRTLLRPPYPETLENGFDEQYGAMRVVATDQTIRFEGIATDGTLFDSFTLDRQTAWPAAPAGLSAAPLNDVRVRLSWTDGSDNEAGFRVERSSDGGTLFRPVTTVDAGVTSYVDSPPAAGASYVYRVRAVNNAGASAPSEPARVTTTGRVTFVAPGSLWKFKDDGLAPPDAWRGLSFDDGSWRSGNGELGYGDQDEQTVVGYGPDINNRHVTTWFRRTFEAGGQDLSSLRGLHLRLRRDDGAAVYLNGVEVFRSNLPSGPLTAATRAAAGVTFADEQLWQKADISPAVLRAGQNVLAVEVHQFGVTRFARDGDDLSFDLELVGSRDVAPPAAVLAARPPAGGADAHTFTVTYRDDWPMGPAAAGDGDVLVTGPAGYSAAAQLLSSTPSDDGATVAATYHVPAPGGTWDSTDAGVYTVTLRAGEVADGSGNYAPAGTLGAFGWGVPPSSLAGGLFDDRNLNAFRDAGESPLAGFEVYLDANGNARLDPGERTAVSDAAGRYVFPDLPAQAHTVRAAPRDGWRPATLVGRDVTGGVYTVTLRPGESAVAADIGLSGRAVILGHVLNDVDGSTYWNEPDVPLAGQTVYLDLDDDGEPGPGEPAIPAGPGGRFRFDVHPGTYVVRWDLPEGWRPTLPFEPGQYTTTLYAGDVGEGHTLAATRMFPDAGGPYSVAEGGTLHLSAAASRIANTPIVGYEWDFDYDGVTFRPDVMGHGGPTAVFPAGVDGAAGAGTLRTVGLRVLEPHGRPSAVATTAVRVLNEAPAVDAGPDADLGPLEQFVLSGTFTDPGPDAWAATVDWDDGAGPQPLALRPDKTFVATRALAPGVHEVRVTVRDDDGAAATDSAVVRVAGTAVINRRLFYNNSAFDGRDPAANARDDDAEAPDKRALLEASGGDATLANLSSYSRGINGVFVDLYGLPDTPGTILGAGDFVFRVGVGGDPAGWAAAPTPTSVTVRRGAGARGADRISLVWPDGAIVNRWLGVTVLPTPATGLSDQDVFYFGNLVGNAIDAPGANPTVGLTDYASTRAALFSAARITSRNDFNRDGRVGVTDLAIARSNRGRSLGAVSPAPAAAAAALAPVAAPPVAAPLTVRRVWAEDEESPA